MSPSSHNHHHHSTSQRPSLSVRTDNSGQPEFVVRKRVGKACDSCRIKKSKCDGRKPCSRCIADDKICTFTERKRSKEKLYSSRYVELLENRIEILQNGMTELVRRVSRGDDISGLLSKSGHVSINRALEELSKTSLELQKEEHEHFVEVHDDSEHSEHSDHEHDHDHDHDIENGGDTKMEDGFMADRRSSFQSTQKQQVPQRSTKHMTETIDSLFRSEIQGSATSKGSSAWVSTPFYSDPESAASGFLSNLPVNSSDPMFIIRSAAARGTSTPAMSTSPSSMTSSDSSLVSSTSPSRMEFNFPAGFEDMSKAEVSQLVYDTQQPAFDNQTSEINFMFAEKPSDYSDLWLASLSQI
ncbi:hypothetical protein V1511DRAFT_488162 [Dipodascopsis uninucleata]